MSRDPYQHNRADRTAGITVRRHPLIAVLIFTSVLVISTYSWWGLGAFSLYGTAVFLILGTKLFLSLLPNRQWTTETRVDHIRAGAVVTVFNEDPEYLQQCLNSLLDQTHRLEHIVVVDDCSTSDAALEVAEHFAVTHPSIVTVLRQPVNMGKRQAIARGFEHVRASVDVFVGIDSDTVLDQRAIEEGLRPFADPTVSAATGLVVAENHEANVLTRLIDVRYVNAFLGERAAYSRFGSILCVCGSLAFYRASCLTSEVLHGFLNQRFLGQVATVGDDRHLTNLCLRQGRVVLAENSIAQTAVPERLGHYVRQQARWGRSFFRESLWALRHQRMSSAAWWLTLLELVQWGAFTTLLIYAIAVHPFLFGGTPLLPFLFVVGAIALARSARYFDVVRADQTAPSRWLSFASSPLYGYMNLLVMIPLRIYSLMTLGRTAWGTRKAVEVTV